MESDPNVLQITNVIGMAVP